MLLLVFVVLVVAVRMLISLVQFRRAELAIPGPPSLPVLGNTLAMLGVTEDTVLSRLHALWDRRNSKLWRLSAFGQLVVVTSDPDHLREVFTRKELSHKDRFLYKFLKALGLFGLIPLNGTKWRTHRRALQPALHPNVVGRYDSVFSSEALRYVGRVQPGVAQAVEPELTTAFTRFFLMTAIASDQTEDEVARALPDVLAFLGEATRSMSYRSMQPWLWPDWAYRLTASSRNMQSLKKKVERLIYGILDDRRHKLAQRRVEDPDGGDSAPAAGWRTLIDVLLEPGAQPSLPDNEILDEFVLFLVAATDTTVSTLSWAFKTLSVRPDVQQRLLEEVHDVLGAETPTEITTGDLAKLQYAECVLKETLRLLPTVPFVGREAGQPMAFGGYTLPAGTTLLVDILGAHRDPDHWPDPLRFDPDRFLPENSRGRHPYAYLPFSTGSRNCIGGRYAMMAMKTVLATLVPRYRIDPVDDGFSDPASFPMASSTSSWMVGGARVVFTPRAGRAA